MNEKVVIIGGGGFIGTHLGRRMMELGHKVSSVDIAYDPDDLKYGQYLKPHKNLLEESTIIIHLASVVGVGNVEQDQMGTIDTTYQTVKDILPYCDGSRKILYASTSEVCADGDNTAESNPVRIDKIDNIRSSYKLTKLLAENMILSKGGMVIRPFNVTGVGQTIEKAVIPKMINDGMKLGVIKVYASGTQVRSFMGIDDACTAILHVLDTHDNDKADNGIYNIGNDRNKICMLDLALAIQIRLGTEPKVEHVGFASIHPKSFEIYNRVPVIDKIGLKFDYNLTEMIDEMIEDQRNG